jgi:DNA-binding NtrC family response regulator
MAVHARPRPEILVVDDDLGARETTKLILNNAGIATREVETGSAAIRACQAQRFDLALIDFGLPDMTGLDVVTQLQAQGICCPFILVSGWMTAPIAIEAKRLGALDAVSRAVDIEHHGRSALDVVSAGPG